MLRPQKESEENMDTSGGSLIVLGWHNVEGTWCFPSAPGAGTRGLERQLRTLHKLTNVVPLGWALEAMSSGLPLPPRAVAVTFDDGYRDNLTLAGPLLRELTIPATCFLVPGILSADVVPWWERLAHALWQARVDHIEWEGDRLDLVGPTDRRSVFRSISEQLKSRDHVHREAAIDEFILTLNVSREYSPAEQFLDWDGARELQEYMEIGSHSMRHSILSQETPQAQQRDLRDSREQLCEGLGTDIQVLAYPNGTARDYDSNTLAAAERAGYSFAVTTECGRNDRSTPRYEIRRWVMRPEWGVTELGKIIRDLLWRRRR